MSFFKYRVKQSEFKTTDFCIQENFGIDQSTLETRQIFFTFSIQYAFFLI